MEDQELEPLYVERRDQLKQIVASMVKPKIVQGRTQNGKEFVSFLGQVILFGVFIDVSLILMHSCKIFSKVICLCFRYLRLWIKVKFHRQDRSLKFSIRPFLNDAWRFIMQEWKESVYQYQWINFSRFTSWQKMKLESSSTSSISVNIMLLSPSSSLVKRWKRFAWQDLILMHFRWCIFHVRLMKYRTSSIFFS